LGIRLATVLATTICAKAFITYVRVTVPAANILAADVIVTGSFHRHLVPFNRYEPYTSRLPFAKT